jgi:hypothetical protein
MFLASLPHSFVDIPISKNHLTISIPLPQFEVASKVIAGCISIATLSRPLAIFHLSIIDISVVII